MTADALAELIAELPEGMVVTDPAITESYRQDRALDPSAGKPMAVVRPLRTEDVQTVLRWATQHRVPVVPRGAGSGLSESVPWRECFDYRGGIAIPDVSAQGCFPG